MTARRPPRSTNRHAASTLGPIEPRAKWPAAAWARSRVTVGDLRGYAREGHFAGGSMGPKVDAACRFVEAGGSRAVITRLDQIVDAITNDGGTVVVPDQGEN